MASSLVPLRNNPELNKNLIFLLQRPFFLFLAIFTCGILASCSSAKSLDQGIHNANKKQPAIIYPAQHKATPDDVNYVYDYEALFSPEQEKKLDTLVRYFEKSNLIPIKINTVTSIIAPAGITAFGKQDLQDWDIVHGRSNNSMTIIISKSLNQSLVNFGDGVNRFLSHEEVSQIISMQYQPLAGSGNYFGATYNMVAAITDAIRKNIHFNPKRTKLK